jgi:RecA-family ATPase
VLHRPDAKLPKLLWADDIEVAKAADYIVKDLIHRGDFSSLYGPSGAGKSFFYADLGVHVSLGKDWRGLKVRKGGVLIVALEGQRGLKNRIIAQRMHHKADNLPLAVWQVPIDFA